MFFPCQIALNKINDGKKQVNYFCEAYREKWLKTKNLRPSNYRRVYLLTKPALDLSREK